MRRRTLPIRGNSINQPVIAQLPSRDLPAELPRAEKPVKTVPARGEKNTNTSPKGWEFWA